MQEIDIRIQELNKTICENIELIDFTSRGLVSQNILSQARNLVEHVAMKAYGTEHDLTVGYGDIKTSLSFIKTDNKYLFLRKFHEFLQESRSHYGSSHEGAERLILKYYKYLVELKNFVKDEYGLEILQNIDKFPVNTDKTIQEYYEKIADVLKQNRPLVQYNKGERYYVKKIKSFIVDGKVYYENTLTPVADNISKMDRFIAFSKNMIPYHYAINASIFMDEIEIKNKKMPVNVLGDFRVSIRPCELSNFAKFFGTTIKMDTGSAEYIGMMNYLTRSGASLTDIALMPEQTYQNIRSMMIGRAKVVKFIGILDICRQILLGKGPASNTLAYLLATLNNRVLKLQYYREANKLLAGLYLKYGCIPFDDMPFASNLIKHVPETSELYGCISVNGREHELKNEGITDVVILTCKSEFKSILKENSDNGTFKKKVFTTCRKFKGLEADAIILIDVDEDTFGSEAVQRFYVGASRARLRLEIVTTMTDENCEKVLREVVDYKKKIKNAKRELALAFNTMPIIE